jgi:hypothetical protein
MVDPRATSRNQQARNEFVRNENRKLDTQIKASLGQEIDSLQARQRRGRGSAGGP